MTILEKLCTEVTKETTEVYLSKEDRIQLNKEMFGEKPTVLWNKLTGETIYDYMPTEEDYNNTSDCVVMLPMGIKIELKTKEDVEN